MTGGADILRTGQELGHKSAAPRQKDRLKRLAQLINKCRIKLCKVGFHNNNLRIEQPGYVCKQQRQLRDCLLHIRKHTGIAAVFLSDILEGRHRAIRLRKQPAQPADANRFLNHFSASGIHLANFTGIGISAVEHTAIVENCAADTFAYDGVKNAVRLLHKAAVKADGALHILVDIQNLLREERRKRLLQLGCGQLRNAGVKHHVSLFIIRPRHAHADPDHTLQRIIHPAVQEVGNRLPQVILIAFLIIIGVLI